MIQTLSYKLRIYPNKSKLELLRYACNRYLLYLNYFVGSKFFYGATHTISTKRLGTLVNQAQEEARGIISAIKAATKITGNKENVPVITYNHLTCKIKVSKEKNSFDYWIVVPNLWTKGHAVNIPAKSYSKLNDKIRKGWILSKECKIYQDKYDQWHAMVYVKKEAPMAPIKNRFLGIDVGWHHSVARSDGYLGKSLKNMWAKAQKKSKSRQINGLKASKNKKTEIKQLLDVEVKRTLLKAKRLNVSIAVENPKQLSHLRRMARWAMSYFGNRLQIRAKEVGVWLTYVNPAYTSITCSKCKHIDKKSRVNRSNYICTACNSAFHADINAARNIALKGQEGFNFGPIRCLEKYLEM